MTNPTTKDYWRWFNRRKQNNQVTLTEQEFMDLWQDSGLWSQHGASKDSFVLARKDLDGAYEADNVEIITKKESAARAGKRGHGK